MTSPERIISQAVCVCLCVHVPKSLNRIGPLHLVRLKAQQRLHKDAPTPAPSLALQLSKTCQRRPRMHSLILEDRPLWPLTYSICAALRPLAPHADSGVAPQFSDAQSPSVTLTFHLHKDRHDVASLCSLLTSSAVSFTSKKMMDAQTNFSFFSFLRTPHCLTVKFEGPHGCFCMLTSCLYYIKSVLISAFQAAAPLIPLQYENLLVI